MTQTGKPAILRGVHPGSEVRFTYTFKDGQAGYVSGTFIEAPRRQDGTVTRFRARVGVNSRIPAGLPLAVGDEPLFDIDRIQADAETGLIIPVSRKERATGTGGARYLAPSDRQVAYALSLCNRDGDLGGGNFYRPAEAEFRAMSRPQISEWIDTARFELGI